jgi:hypothetical protein
MKKEIIKWLIVSVLAVVFVAKCTIGDDMQNNGIKPDSLSKSDSECKDRECCDREPLLIPCPHDQLQSTMEEIYK